MRSVDQGSVSARSATRGKVVVVSAIVLVVILVLLIGMVKLLLPVSRTHPFGGSMSIGFGVAILLCCVDLYRGSNWSRWVLGCFLAVVGLLWAHLVISDLPTRPDVRQTAFAAATMLVLIVGGLLMFSPDVREFGLVQRGRQRPVTSKALKAAWIVLGAFLVVTILADFLAVSARSGIPPAT